MIDVYRTLRFFALGLSNRVVLSLFLCTNYVTLRKIWVRSDSSYLRSTERILFTSFFSPVGFTTSRGYWPRIQAFAAIQDWLPHLASNTGIDPMPDKRLRFFTKDCQCTCHSGFLWNSCILTAAHLLSKVVNDSKVGETNKVVLLQ